MCEYCGCQRIDVIGQLTREHDEVVALVAVVRQQLNDGDVANAAGSARSMLALLEPHTAVEEDGLFPELSADFPDHVEVLRGEHREIELVLGEASGGPPNDPTWPARLTAAMSLLRDHVLKEQDGVFPAALGSLDAAAWERVEAIRDDVARRSADPPASTAQQRMPELS